MSLDQTSKDDVFSVQPGALHEGEAELRRRAALSCVDHREKIGLVMLLFEFLKRKAVIIEQMVLGVARGCGIAALRHVVEDYFLEGSVFVGEPSLSGAKLPEFLSSPWGYIVVELKGESPLKDPIYFYLKKAERSVSHLSSFDLNA